MAGPDGLLDDLRAAVGPAHVLTEPDRRAPYERDWTGRFGAPCRAVVRPADTAEVAAVLAACTAAGAAVVPQGGNTGLVGGSVPAGGELVLSLRRLGRVGEVDPAAAQVTVGAGVTLAALQAALAPAGLEPGVDLAARGSATLGGMAATNAGGTRVLSHGTMRHQVVGTEAVLADGRVLRSLRGLPKDTSGYDLTGLLVGSEGTLAVLTAVRLSVVPRPAARAAAVLAVRSLADAVAAARSLHDRLPELSAAEVTDGALVDAVDARHGLAPALRPTPPWTVLVEVAGDGDLAGRLAAAVERAPGVADTAVAEGGRVAGLWAHRELATETLAALGPPRKLDVSLPLVALDRFAAALGGVVGAVAPATRVHLFGHLLDGNLHCQFLGVDEATGDELDAAVLGLAAELGGSIGAEHGVGRAKRRHLHLVRSPEELAAFAAVKAALDPAGTLNPGVLLP